MLRLKRHNESPPGGYPYKDEKTGFKCHTWSFNATVAQWYQECQKRNIVTTLDTCRRDVEQYVCRELLKLPGWEAWVFFDQQPSYKAGDMPSIVVRRTGAMGDVLMASTIADKLSQQGFGVVFQSDPATHCLLTRIPSISQITTVSGDCDVNLDGVYEHSSQRTNRKATDLFLEAANQQLSRKNIHLGFPFNQTPHLKVVNSERDHFRRLLKDHPQPWIMVCPCSANWKNRTIPDETWQAMAKGLPGTVLWIGMKPAPVGIVDLSTRHFDNVIRYLSVADLLVTTDTGPMHVAAALNVPVIAIEQASSPECHLSDQNDFITVRSPHITCQNCQKDLCPIEAHNPPCQRIDPQIIKSAVVNRLEGKGKVSVVVAIYRPEAQRLNKCLTHVLPQCDEVVVAWDSAGILPQGALKDPKIRYVRSRESDTGYGRKANFGARHTTGEFIWFLNDDCFVHDNCAQKLLSILHANPRVGMVGHILYYLDGTIQHGGTFRATDGVGFGHMDLGLREGRIKQPLEVENVTGASILMRRKAFYDARGFDEDFKLYCEDNDLCMKVRKAGWKIYYSPHAEAIHEEHCSTKMTQDIHAIMVHSQSIFYRKWHKYFEDNRNNPGLGVFA